MTNLMINNTDILDKYNKETIDFMKKCVDEIENLTVLEFIGEDLVEVPPDEMQEMIRRSYLQAGVGEGIVDTVEEFDELYSILR